MLKFIKLALNQNRIHNPLKNLKWSFLQKMVNVWKRLNTFVPIFVLDVSQGSEYASVNDLLKLRDRSTVIKHFTSNMSIITQMFSVCFLIISVMIYSHCFFIAKKACMTIRAFLNFDFIWTSFYVKFIPLQFASRFDFVLKRSF